MPITPNTFRAPTNADFCNLYGPILPWCIDWSGAAAEVYSKIEYGTLPPVAIPVPNAPETKTQMVISDQWTPEMSMLQPGELAQENIDIANQYQASGLWTPEGIKNPLSPNTSLIGLGVLLVGGLVLFEMMFRTRN